MNKIYKSNPKFAEFCAHFENKPEEIPTETVGHYQIANPGIKDMKNLIDKIWRKLYEENCSQEFINEHKAFNLISDYARLSVLMPSFVEAPALLGNLMDRLGGELTIHDRPAYKAFHLHTQKNGVNCEIQLHTPETFALKEVTALKYEKWRKPLAEKPAETKSNPEYQEETALEKQLCQDIYQRSGFDVVKDSVEVLKQFETAVAPMKHKEFLIIMGKAEKVQEELLQLLREELLQIQNHKIASNTPDIRIPSVDEFALIDNKTM